MGQRTAKQAAAAGEDQPPPDLTVMRQTARRLLDPDVLMPPADELDTLILTLRGQMQLMLPEVEAAAERVGRDEVMYWCAHACLGEARRKLTVRPGTEQGAAAAYARRLARSLNALCDHYVNLNDAEDRPANPPATGSAPTAPAAG